MPTHVYGHRCWWPSSSVWGFSDVINLRRFDVSFLRGDSPRNVTVCFSKSKNDQGGMGVSRSLVETSINLCPVRAFSRWLIKSDWGPQIDDLVPPSNIRNSVESLIKYAGLPNNIPMADIITHSLRSGGATTLYHVGVDMGTIQKWGRWNSRCFLRYIWFSSSVMGKLGERMIQCKPLIAQLKTVAVPQKRTRFLNPMETISESAISDCSAQRAVNPEAIEMEREVSFPIQMILFIRPLIVSSRKQ